jgi:DNA-binding NtrC family response regulator
VEAGALMLRALVVDDDPNSVAALAALVQREGFAVSTAGSLREARQRLTAEAPDLILVDLVLPDGSGLELLQIENGVQPGSADVVLITGHASVETAVEALRRGAADYLTKPLDLARLKAVLAGFTRTHELKGKIVKLRDQLRQLGHFGPLVGTSAAMQQVYDLVSRVAPTQATVLISGESGTGKELVAETIHQLSKRSAWPFLAINCGAVSPTLIESELFGHERGSFTGAERTHRGYFQRADGGTLFLDEVSEMPLELQVKLLRVLETGSVQRVGGDRAVAVDVRVLAATNRDLDEAVATGRVRKDLLYRLKVFPISVPPLRERPEDVDALARHFLEQLNQAEKDRKRLLPEALAALRSYSWPGNVRELKNVIHRAFILSEGDLALGSLPPELTGGVRFDPAPSRVGLNSDQVLQVPVGTPLAEVERRMLLAALEHFGGDKQKTADALGVSLKTIYNRLHSYGVK